MTAGSTITMLIADYFQSNRYSSIDGVVTGWPEAAMGDPTDYESRDSRHEYYGRPEGVIVVGLPTVLPMYWRPAQQISEPVSFGRIDLPLNKLRQARKGSRPEQ